MLNRKGLQFGRLRALLAAMLWIQYLGLRPATTLHVTFPIIQLFELIDLLQTKLPPSQTTGSADQSYRKYWASGYEPFIGFL